MTTLSTSIDYFNQQEQQPSSDINNNEKSTSLRECLLFPTYAYRNPEKSSEWIIRTKGWALSHNRSGAKQKLMTSLTKGVVGQNNSGDQTIFEERFKYFLAKNKRNKHFLIQPIGTTSLPSDSWTFLRRDSNGSTDSGFQSATTTNSSSKEDYFFWNYNDDLQLNDNNDNNNINNDNNNNDVTNNNNNNNMFMMMERPANPLSSILSGRRSLQSNTSISSTLSTSPDQIHQNQFYQQDEDDEDDGDDENDEDDQLPSNEYYLGTSSASSDLNSPSMITTTITKPSLLNYPSFKSNHSLLSNSSTVNNTTTTTSTSTLNNNNNNNNSSSTLFKSESNGFFSGNIEFSHDQVLHWAKEQDCCDSRILKLQAIENKSDPFHFPISQGIVNLIEPTGISIISDIDDTIKETQILHGARTVLQNTFFNPTNDIPGMAEAYMKWYTQGASFHYVSNSPFQLLPFLQNFLNESQFPPGSMHLRLDGSLLARLIEIPGRAKRDAILSIMNDFPKRQFVLVGDSGEIDLEIYTKIALEHPDRILKIFIHDITTKYAHYKQQKKLMQQQTNINLTTSNSTTTNHSITSTSSSTNNNNGGSLSLTSLFQSSSTTTTTSSSTKRKSSLSISTFMNNMNINSKNDEQQENDSLSNSMDDLFSTITRSTTTGSSQSSSSPLSSSSSSLRSSSLLEMASSITSPSFLGLGKNNQQQSKKTLANILTEPPLSSSSSSTTTSSTASSLYYHGNNNNNTNDLPPSQQCAQLYDRIKKSQDQLPNHIQIVLFQDADELRDDPIIHDALWQHWDNQC